MRLKAHVLLSALTMLLVSVAQAEAQTTDPSQMTGQWSVTVEGEARSRTFDVTRVLPKGDDAYTVEGTYGFSDGNLHAVPAELRRQGGKWQMSIVTPAESVVTLQSTDLVMFAGNIVYKSGTSKGIKLERSSSSRQWLGQKDVETMLVGKRVTIKREDGVELYWQAAIGGDLFAQNSRGGRDSGHWDINDEGGFCMTWNGNSKNGCQYFYHGANPESLLVTAKRSPLSAPWGEVHLPQ